MIWITVLTLISGAALIKLGALSVRDSVLALSLKVVSDFIVAIGIFMIWAESRCRK